jgi:scyllo-inositol 2-dehydrogenase (NADP+)
LRVIVVGLGVQGHKRREHAGPDYVASVDPVNTEADFRIIEDVPLDTYDAVLACVPDEPKNGLLRYCLDNKKHVLVEKPLWVQQSQYIKELEQLALRNKVICYTAYNHRFEPHIKTMRDLLVSGKLGKIYSCRIFYGNGTARLVRSSAWRDSGAGVLPDLGSHLLDICRFWFGEDIGPFELSSVDRFENAAPDHVVVSSLHRPRIELEMTLCMWRNHFVCDILAENGSAHIESLCKWGPSTFTHRTRVLPAGRPSEEQVTLITDDPTWADEYAAFKALVSSATPTDLSRDYWLQTELSRLAEEI